MRKPYAPCVWLCLRNALDLRVQEKDLARILAMTQRAAIGTGAARRHGDLAHMAPKAKSGPFEPLLAVFFATDAPNAVPAGVVDACLSVVGAGVVDPVR